MEVFRSSYSSRDLENALSGGGSTLFQNIIAKDVNFYDYDGRRVAAYTLAEARALTELPTPPTHPGLVFEGWNWELSEINALKIPMEIGAMYYTDDDSMRLYISIEDLAHAEIAFAPAGLGSDTGDIDWGDGVIERDIRLGVGDTPYTHTYDTIGNYIIRVTNKIQGGYTVLTIRRPNVNLSMALRAVEMPLYRNSLSVSNLSLSSCYRLQYVTLNSKTEAFEPNKISCNIMPRGCTFSYGRDNYFGEIVSIAPTATGFGTYGHGGSYRVCRFTIPEGITKMETYCCKNMHGLSKLILPTTITEIGNQAIHTIPGLAYLVSLPTTPPTLSSTNSITSIPDDCVFYVPDASLDAYKTATNWSTYADRMLPLSEYPFSDIII